MSEHYSYPDRRTTVLRRLWLISAAALAACLIVATTRNPAATYVKASLFLHATASEAEFNSILAPKDEGLTPVPRDFHAQIATIQPFGALLQRASDPPTSTARVRALMSRLGARPVPTRSCGAYTDAVDLIRIVGRGDGCCSDFGRAFTFLAPLIGVRARIVWSRNHGFVEFWEDNERRWIFLDPTLGIMARSGERLLSAVELGRLLREGAVRWVPVSASAAEERRHHMAEFYGDPRLFDELHVRTDDRVFAHDAFERKLAWLPRAVRQFVGIVTGDLPRAVMLTEHPLRVTLLSWSITAIALGLPLLFLVTSALLILAGRGQRSVVRFSLEEQEDADSVHLPMV